MHNKALLLVATVSEIPTLVMPPPDTEGVCDTLLFSEQIFAPSLLSCLFSCYIGML